MNTLHKIFSLLSLAFILVACNKDDESGSWTPIPGLKGKWAPVTPTWTVSRYIELDKGVMSTYELYSDHVFKDGIIWNWSSIIEPKLLSSTPYAVKNGHLFAGNTNVGACSIQDDTLKIDQQKYLRLVDMVHDSYTHFNFGPGIDPLRPVIKTGKAGKTIKIPCTLQEKVPFRSSIFLCALSNRVDNLRINNLFYQQDRDTLTLHIDENTTESNIRDSILIDHPATGTVIMTFIQYPVWPSFIEVEGISAEGIQVDAGLHPDVTISYKIISPGKDSDKCSCTFNPAPAGDWVKINSQSSREINMAIFRNVDDTPRETTLVLSYPDSKDVLIPIRQEKQQ